MSKKKNREVQQQEKRNKTLVPRTKNQAEYIRAIAENDVTLCSGPAGSGKTMIAVGLACEYLISNKIDKIVVTRPIIESGRGMGYLPGTMLEKVHPYLIPVLEEMEAFLGKEALAHYRATNKIEICPLEFMRGRNFHDSFMILDESQNCTMDQLKMFITRIGVHSKAVLNGDIQQTDLPEYTKDSFLNCINSLRHLDGVAICELKNEDIVRNKIIASILGRLNQCQ